MLQHIIANDAIKVFQRQVKGVFLQIANKYFVQFLAGFGSRAWLVFNSPNLDVSR